MAEFVFPEINAHSATVNGWNLLFAPGAVPPLLMSEQALSLLQNCSGMTINQCKDWLRERFGEESTVLARHLGELVDSGYFADPQLDLAECEAIIPATTLFGICITHRCNMRCKYCFAAPLRQSDQPADISSDTARAAVDFVFDTLQPPWVTFSLGITGEPQLNWDTIKDVIEYAKTRSEETAIGVRFHITTNGFVTSPDMLDYLRANDDLNVTLSWDGPPRIHNLQRIGPDDTGTYDRVRNTFETFQNTMRWIPSVSATITHLNPDAAGIFAHLFDEGVRDLIIKPTRSVGPAISITEDSLPEFKAGFANLAELLLQPDLAQIERLYTIVKRDDCLGQHILLVAQGQRTPYRCSAGRCSYDVDTNGDIYPCASLLGVTDFKMGNVHTGLDDVMKSFFAKDTCLVNISACQDCWAKHYCGGPCTYVSTMTCGSYEIPYEPGCELRKYMIELAGYVVARLKQERPGLLEHVLTLRAQVPMSRPPEASCKRAPEGGLWTRPLESWRVQDPIVMASREWVGGYKRWSGPSDSSAEIHLQWDDEFFYLMAEVQDNKFVPPSTPESQWWFYDSIQFGLDPDRDGGQDTYPWKLPEGDYEFGVACVDGETYMYDCQVDPHHPGRSGNAIVSRDDDTIFYRVRIPWQQISGFIPSTGTECGFSVVVNDCDGGARGWLQWTDGLAVKKAPSRFGLLRLVE